MIHIKLQIEDNAEMILKLLDELRNAMEEELQQLKKENEAKAILNAPVDDHVIVLDETRKTEKRERRSCYDCLYYDLNHPVPGEFHRCRVDDHQVYDSAFAQVCCHYREK